MKIGFGAVGFCVLVIERFEAIVLDVGFVVVVLQMGFVVTVFVLNPLDLETAAALHNQKHMRFGERDCAMSACSR